MNRILAAALIAFSATSAFAENPTIDTTPFVPSLSRAQVQAELQQFQAAGASPWAKHYDQLAGFRSGTTRAQVTADFLQSRERATAMTGEDSGSAYLSARRHEVAAPIVAGQPVNAQ